MNSVIYPLGHAESELNRLDAQAMLLRDPLLEQLAAKATSCLEIGCGNGSNLSLIRQANPELNYFGVDISSTAIDAARQRFNCDSKAEFKVMNATDLEFAEANFDLVFTKLVLWSVGNEWKKVLQEASRVMSPGGVFYALEPANDMIDLFPDKPLARKWMNAWDNAAQKQGLDPCIGKKLAHGLKQAGFEDVQSRFFPVIATGMEEERYKSIIKNLEGFYFGPAAMEFGLDMRLKAAAQAELNALSRESLVTDALFVSWAKKS